VPLAMTIVTLALVILITDTVVYQQYRFHLNAAVMSLFFSKASGEIFEFSTRMKWEIGLLIVGIIIVQWVLARLVWLFIQRIRGRGYGYALASILVAFFIGTNLYYAWADAKDNTLMTRQALLLPWYAPLKAKGFLKRHGVNVASTSAVRE